MPQLPGAATDAQTPADARARHVFDTVRTRRYQLQSELVHISSRVEECQSGSPFGNHWPIWRTANFAAEEPHFQIRAW